MVRTIFRSNFTSIKQLSFWALVIFGGLLLASPACAQSGDQKTYTYYGSKINSSADWFVYDRGYGPLFRTDWGLSPIPIIPTQGSSFGRFTLHRYQKFNQGNRPSNWRSEGTEVSVNTPFGLKPGHALEFEAKMRLPEMAFFQNNNNPSRRPVGVLCAFYVYQDEHRGKKYGLKRNEIDFEMPQQLLAQDVLWLNVWRDGRGLSDSGARQAVSSHPWEQWLTYKMVWTSTKVEWFIGDQNGANYKSVRKKIVSKPSWPIPNQARQLRVHFNIWSPPTDWTIGDARYQPSDSPSADRLINASNPKQGKGNYFDVMWARVTYRKVSQGTASKPRR